MAGDDETEQLQRLRRAARDEPGALVRLADLLVASGRAEEAAEECRRGVSARPDDVQVRLALARALSAAGDLDEAQSVFLEAATRQKEAKARAARAAAAPPAAKVPTPNGGARVPPNGNGALAAGGAAAAMRLPPAATTDVEGLLAGDRFEEDEETTVSRGRAPVRTPTPQIISQQSAAFAVARARGDVTRPEGRVDATEKTRSGIEIDVDADEVQVLTPTPTPTPALIARGAATAMPGPTPIGEGAQRPRSTAAGSAEDRRRSTNGPPPPARLQRAPTPPRASAVIAPASRPSHDDGSTLAMRTPGQVSAVGVPASVIGPDGSIDLDAVAAQLHDNVGLGWRAAPETAALAGDPVALGFFRSRRRAHLWLWAALTAVAGGLVGGTLYKVKQIRAMIAQKTQLAIQRGSEATYDGNLGARDALGPVLGSRLHERDHLALAALVSARLYAEDADETEGAVQALLKRADKEAQRKEPARDAPTELNFLRTRALLALGHGETCPAPLDTQVDGAIAARCLIRRGDVAGARKILEGALQTDESDVRALLELGAIASSQGDLEAGEDAYRRVLKLQPNHPRALVGLSLLALERGKIEPLGSLPPQKLGVVGESWWHLGLGAAALARGEEEAANHELDLASPGALRDGRLAARLGLAKIELGRVSEAERALRLAARLAPADPDIGSLDAEIAVAKGFEDKVAQNLAGKDGPPRLLAIRGRAEFLSGKYKEAASSLEAALVKRPGDVVAATYRALAKAKGGQLASATNDLDRLARAHPSNTVPRYGLGLLAYERRDLATARAELAKALVRDPEAFRAGAMLGRVDRELGRTADAVAELEKVTQDDDSLVAAHQVLGRLYHDLGRDGEARSELRRVVEAKRATAEDRLAYAESVLALGVISEADKLLTEAQTAGAPASLVARDRLILQATKGGPAGGGAAKALEKMRRGPEAKSQRLALEVGEAWRHVGDLRHAAETFRAAATLGADKLHPNLGLGKALLAAGDYPGAEGAFRAALSAFGGAPYGEADRTEVRVGLGRSLIGKKSYTEAVALLESARDEAPEEPELRYWLAKGYAEAADSGKARVELEKAVQLDESYASAWLLLADVTERSDRPTAQKALRRVLELQPDAANAKQLKRRLASLK